MMWLKYSFLLIVLGTTVPNKVYATVVLGTSRVIYESTQKEVSIPVRNSDEKRAYLVQSWVDNALETDKSKTPFIITPPLFRLDPDQENRLRLVFTTANLPTDRETVFWLNVKGIPSVEKNEKNRLLLSVNNRIKLFYRPEGLAGNAGDAYKQLSFSMQGSTLFIKNPSPYHVSFNELSVGGEKIIEPGMVPPKGELTHTLSPGMKGAITWSAINDFGGVTSLLSQ